MLNCGRGVRQCNSVHSLRQIKRTSREVGRRGAPVSLLTALARRLGVGVETHVGEPTRAAKRGPARRSQQQVERLSRLPKAKQRLLIEM